MTMLLGATYYFEPVQYEIEGKRYSFGLSVSEDKSGRLAVRVRDILNGYDLRKIYGWIDQLELKEGRDFICYPGEDFDASDPVPDYSLFMDAAIRFVDVAVPQDHRKTITFFLETARSEILEKRRILQTYLVFAGRDIRVLPGG